MTETIEAAVGSPADVELDLPCYRCGYNVRGLAADGRCPECAAAVNETLRRDEAQRAGRSVPLGESDPRWVRTLARGAALMLFGGVGMMAGQAFSAFGPDIPRTASIPIFLSPFVALGVGAWMIAAREPVHSGRRAAWLCVMIRAGVIGWGLSMGAFIAVVTFGSWSGIFYSLIANGVVSAVLSWSCFWRFRAIAGRLDRPLLRVGCAWLAFLTVAACGVAFIPGAGEIELRPNEIQMSFPVPVFADSLLIVLLPYSLVQLPRFDALTVVHGVIALVSLAALIALAVLCRSLYGAARRARRAAGRAG